MFSKCENDVYVGEIYRIFETSKEERKATVRLTKKNIENGNIDSAKVRMGKEDRGKS